VFGIQKRTGLEGRRDEGSGLGQDLSTKRFPEEGYEGRYPNPYVKLGVLSRCFRKQKEIRQYSYEKKRKTDLILKTRPQWGKLSGADMWKGQVGACFSLIKLGKKKKKARGITQRTDRCGLLVCHRDFRRKK